MISKIDKNEVRKERHDRMRFYLSGTAEKPRLNVYRSLKNIYAQIIDDTANDGNGATLVSANTLEKEIAEQFEAMKKADPENIHKADAAKLVGKVIAERALAKGITEVVFDRGGYLYTGRVAAVADGAREAGLKI